MPLVLLQSSRSVARKWAWPIFGVLISALATILLVTFFGSESFQKCICGDQRYRSANALISNQSIFTIQLVVRCTGIALEEHNAAITAIASLVIAVFTATLWHATKSMLKASADQSVAMERSIRQSARAATAMEEVAKYFSENVTILRERTAKQMRSYLSVIVFEGSYQERQRNIRFEARPLILNTGQTPAHKVGFRAKAAILPTQLPNDFAFPLPDEIVGAATLGPHQNFIMNAAVAEFCDDADVGAIKVGSERILYIWGIVTYKDIFGDEQFTKFCHAMTWRPDGKIFGRFMTDYNEST